ncbi:YdjY domain-containing protein [Aquibacillus kalidii]|uniref:YdjY domain-containing protein n=1 Tax=Aquibacillus kalidii TaxID=2762597 RepID=UPI001C99E6D4|nr:YdjY domain-containing protein [Aquibacillus kalidii]
MFLKKNYLVMLLFVLIGVLGGCSNNSSAVDEGELESNYASSEETLDKEQSIYINTEDKKVKVYATVNGKYLRNPTRHGLNWVEGSNGHKSVFDGYASPLAFYNALAKIGGNPALEKGGDEEAAFEVKEDGKYIKGDEITVTISWNGIDKPYDINEVMVDSTGKKIAYHFGGNYEAAKEKMTGCFMCFDSCPVGIVSNATHPVGTFKDGVAEFRGNPEILPDDGTPVVLTYQFVDSK